MKKVFGALHWRTEVDVFVSDPQQHQQEKVDTHSDGLKQEPMSQQHVTH